MPRLQIRLTEQTLARLQELARAERRAPRDQATVIIERSLSIGEPPMGQPDRRLEAAHVSE